MTYFAFARILYRKTYLVTLIAGSENAFLIVSINNSDCNSLIFLRFFNVFLDESVVLRNRFSRVFFCD